MALTSDSGYFWFFDPSNVEVAVKALNGCTVNSHYWVFAGGLTNVEVAMTVTDTVTGEDRTYSNLQGNAFQPIIDTTAFASCTAGAAALSAANPEEPDVEASLTVPVRSPEDVRASSELGCVEGDTVLCVNGRFRVEAAWQTASGASGLAYAVPLTSESGYFWFFGPSNVELIVKFLDGCSIGQGHWLFAAGMTTVGVQLRVTDTYTGEVKSYDSLLGTEFRPIQDTAAFSFCPTPTPTPTATPTITPTLIRPNPTHTPPPSPTPGPQTLTVTLGESLGSCGYRAILVQLFSPSTIRIHVGDTINWVWASGVHAATSGHCIYGSIFGGLTTCTPDGMWDSGAQTGPFAFSRQFTQTGTFPYFCNPGHERLLSKNCDYRGLNCECFYGMAHESGVVVVDP